MFLRFLARRRSCSGPSRAFDQSLVLALLIISSAMTANTADQSSCDSGLLQEAVPGSLGYANRNDRCEGLYGKYVSTSEPLSLRSFTIGRPSLNPLPGTIAIEWPSGFQGAPHIFAFALKPRVFFQMDVKPAAGGHVFSWKTDVVQAVPLSGTEIGVVIYADAKVVVPAQVGPFPTGSPAPNFYQAVLWPEKSFRTVSRTLNKVEANGSRAAVLPQMELGLGFYPDKRSIPLTFAIPAAAGRYELVVSGEFEGAGGVVLTFPFDSPARR